jgi:hypothetical protein
MSRAESLVENRHTDAVQNVKTCSNLFPFQALTIWSPALLEKLIVTQIVKKYTFFYGIVVQMIMFTRKSHTESD